MDSQNFNIMTYNVYCRICTFFKDSQQDRCKLIPESINEFSDKIDCIIVQEIFDGDAESTLDKQMAKFGFIHKSKKVAKNIIKNYYFFTRLLLEDGGIKIYSKLPILKQSSYIFNNKTGEDKIAGKGVSYIKIQKFNTPIHIFGTHLQSGKTKPKIKVKLKQVEEIQKFIKKQKIPKDELIIFGGDLNVNLIRQPKLLNKVGKILNLKLVNLDLNSFDDKRNDLQFRDNPDSKKKRNLLDHFFYNLDLKSNSLFLPLKSKEPYQIQKPRGPRGTFSIFSKLQKYSNKTIPLYSLSNHEPIIASFILHNINSRNRHT